MNRLCVILLLVCPVGAWATTYQVETSAGNGQITVSRNFGTLSQGTGYRINGTGSLGNYSTNKDTQYLFSSPTQTSNFTLYWGYASNSAGTGWVPLQWWMSVPQGTGPSPHGIVQPDGGLTDTNGTSVDPATGLPLESEMSKVAFDLTNPWQNRWAYFEVDEKDAVTGDRLGTRQYAVGPGESLHVSLGRTDPFTVTPYLMVDGVRNSLGPAVGSTGGHSGGTGSSSATTETTPPVGTTGSVEMPASVAGTTETKLAVDRLATVVGSLNQDLNAGFAETVRGLGKVKDAITGSGGGGSGAGGSLTKDDVKDAVGEAMGNGNTEDDGDTAAGEGEIDSDEGEINNSVDGIRTGMTALQGSAAGVVEALGLDREYDSAEWIFHMSLPFAGEVTLDVEQYGWILDLIRHTLFGCMSLHFVGLFVRRLRGAMVG